MQVIPQDGGEGVLAVNNVLIRLLKGMVCRELQSKEWESLILHKSTVASYFDRIHLKLFVDEVEGYAFLKQFAEEDVDEHGNITTSLRLIPKIQLTYPVSLLCVLLRKKFIEFDSHGGQTRLILSRNEIVEMLMVFSPDISNEVKVLKRIDSHIAKLVQMGFLWKLKSEELRYEAHRIIKAFIDAECLTAVSEKLEEYHNYLFETEGNKDPSEVQG